MDHIILSRSTFHVIAEMLISNHQFHVTREGVTVMRTIIDDRGDLRDASYKIDWHRLEASKLPEDLFVEAAREIAAALGA